MDHEWRKELNHTELKRYRLDTAKRGSRVFAAVSVRLSLPLRCALLVIVFILTLRKLTQQLRKGQQTLYVLHFGGHGER